MSSQKGSIEEGREVGPRLRRGKDQLALEIFNQQAMAIGRLFTIASNFIDPGAYFVGGGVVEASPRFREWFLTRVREHTSLREEQLEVATFALIADLDMAGARGAALWRHSTLSTDSLDAV